MTNTETTVQNIDGSKAGTVVRNSDGTYDAINLSDHIIGTFDIWAAACYALHTPRS